MARLLLATQNSVGGSGEMVALANGGLQLNALNQNIALNTTGGTANLVIEPNTGGSSNGEVICFYGFQKPLGREAQDERPAALGDGGAGALRRRGGQELRSSGRRRQANGLRGAGGLRVGSAGQELLQAQELRGPGAHDAGLPADDGGAVADLQEPAAEDREAGEEEARALLKWRSRRRSGCWSSWPGTSTCATPGSSDSPAGVPGPAPQPRKERGGGAGPAASGGPGGLLAERGAYEVDKAFQT